MVCNHPLILREAGLGTRVPMSECVEAVAEWMALAAVGRATSPPRRHEALGDRSLVCTFGGDESGLGLRVYSDPSPPTPASHQLIAIFDARGVLRGVLIDEAVGEWRTGALGGLAIQRLRPNREGPLALVGAGRQAWTQALAAHTVWNPTEVRVVSKNGATRAAFAARLRQASGLKVHEMANPREALEGAPVVICATNSTTPVLEPEWVDFDAVLLHIGPKRAGQSQLPPDLYNRFGRIVTDAPEQASALNGALELRAHTKLPIEDLAGFPSGPCPAHPDGPTLYLSLGLAGTDVAVARRALSAAPPEAY